MQCVSVELETKAASSTEVGMWRHGRVFLPLNQENAISLQQQGQLEHPKCPYVRLGVLYNFAMQCVGVALETEAASSTEVGM